MCKLSCSWIHNWRDHFFIRRLFSTSFIFIYWKCAKIKTVIKSRSSALVSARSLTMSTDRTFLQLELILAKLPNFSARNRLPWWLNTIWHAVKRIKYFNSPHSLPRHQIHRILHQNLLLALHLDLDRPCYLFASWTPAAGHVYIQDACKWRGQSSSIGCSKTKAITLANRNRGDNPMSQSNSKEILVWRKARENVCKFLRFGLAERLIGRESSAGFLSLS